MVCGPGRHAGLRMRAGREVAYGPLSSLLKSPAALRSPWPRWASVGFFSLSVLRGEPVADGSSQGTPPGRP